MSQEEEKQLIQDPSHGVGQHIPSPNTDWEDLARLGWPKRKVYQVLNAQRGNTMRGLQDLHLNDKLSGLYQWNAWNIVEGSPVLVNEQAFRSSETCVVDVRDNTKNNHPLDATFQVKAINSDAASLNISKRASIPLRALITVHNVASSSFALSVWAASGKGSNRTIPHEVNGTYHVKVGPYEKVELIRREIRWGQVATYHVQYGVHGAIGTSGNKYRGRTDIAFSVDGNLKNPKPSDNMVLLGIYNKTFNIFTLRRTGGKGPVISTALFKNAVEEDTEGQEVEVQDRISIDKASDALEDVEDDDAGDDAILGF